MAYLGLTKQEIDQFLNSVGDRIDIKDSKSGSLETNVVVGLDRVNYGVYLEPVIGESKITWMPYRRFANLKEIQDYYAGRRRE